MTSAKLFEPKVIRILVRMVPHVTAVVNGSRYLPTADKDQIIDDFRRLIRRLLDAHSRSQGRVPLTPGQEKQADQIVHGDRVVSDSIAEGLKWDPT